MKRDGDKIYMNKAEDTQKKIESLNEIKNSIDYDEIDTKETIPCFIAMIETVLEDIAVSLAMIASDMKQERVEKAERVDNILRSSIISAEEKKRIKEQFFKEIEEGKK